MLFPLFASDGRRGISAVHRSENFILFYLIFALCTRANFDNS